MDLQLEALLEHADWVRRLARSLVADPARADDVAQETWLAALKSPPRRSVDVRAWLGAVARNAARRSIRSSERREEREVAAARSEALPSAAELVEQADLQRELAALVIGLDEPYRQTLLLRYYHGLSAEEISARAGVPFNTVRTRMQRGLAALRERLDRRFGERGAWCSALAPMLRAPLATQAAVQGSLWSSLGVLIMAAKLKWFAAAVALLVGLWWWWPRDAAVATSGELASAPKAEPHAIQAPATGETTPLERAPVASNLAPTAPAAQPPRVTSRVHGRCVDLAGVPLAGLEIEWIDDDEAQLVVYRNGAEFRRPSVRTAIDGTFELVQESQGGEIGLVRSDLMVLDRFRIAEFPEPLMIVVPCIALGGSVVDAEHAGIAGATLRWNLSLDGARSFPYLVESGAGNGASVVCDERGVFHFEQLPSVQGYKLHVSAAGHADAWVNVPAQSERELTIVLASAPRVSEQHIAGRVQFRDGRPAAGAQVDFGQYGATAGADGSFLINVTHGQTEDTPLTAFVKGSRPAALVDFGKQFQARDFAIDDALLVLDDALPPIRGRVLDAAGKPCALWTVALIDAQQLGATSETLEATASGEKALQYTDQEGRFQFSGLLDHAYRVRACDSRTMIAIESEAVAPGIDDLILRVPADALLERVAGRVISRGGRPIDGAVISIGLVAYEIGGAQTMLFHEGGRANAQGEFELRNVPRNRCWIGATDKRIQSNSIEFDASMAAKELLIEVDLDLRFRVEPRRAGEFDRFRILDRAGEPVYVHALELAGENYRQEVAQEDGAFPMCSTDESAETLVLYLGEREVRRLPLVLHLGEITILSP